MGACISGNEPVRKREQPMRGKIDIHCPICQENYDIDDRKPYVVCANKHKLCFACLTSMKNHASLKKTSLLCPFCKAGVEEDMVSTDAGIFSFLKTELDTLKRLPPERQKLFAFSSIYLPKLHDFMKKEAKGDGKIDKKSGKRQSKVDCSVDSIELLRIKGRMLEEYQVFEMEILDCMHNLRKIYLSNNHIKAIDTSSFTQNKLTVLDLSFNRITTIKSVLSEPALFAALKVLNVRNNMIEEMPGVNNLLTLQVAVMKNNALKSLRWFVGCAALRHLDVEFNKITERVEFPATFWQMHSLMMFGNNVALESWESFARLNWNSLRLLTATVSKASLLEKYNIHNRIAKLPAPCLKLLIFEMGMEEPENSNDVMGSLSQQEELLSRTRKVELNSDSYIFYSQNESFLRKILDTVMRTHSLGININFKATQVNSTVYQEDERFCTYKKANSSLAPADYLYSLPLGSTAKGKIFVSFLVRTFKLLVGVTDQAQGINRIELNLDREAVAVGKEECRCKPLKDGVRAGEEFTVSIALSVEEGYITFVVGSTQLDKYAITEQWSEHRFYVHLMEQGECIRVVRDELQLI